MSEKIRFLIELGIVVAGLSTIGLILYILPWQQV